MDRQRRIAENEVLWRSVNANIHRITEGSPVFSEDERWTFICECGNKTCQTNLELTAAEYQAVRSDPTRFFVVPGHELVEAERVVEDRGGYLVVEKTGEGRRIAEEDAPPS